VTAAADHAQRHHPAVQAELNQWVRGLIEWRLSDPAVADALRLDHLNPQTVEFTLD
jgi:hypothetical protein